MLLVNASNTINIQQFCDLDNQLESIIETTINKTLDK